MAATDPICSYVNPNGESIDLSDSYDFVTLDFDGTGLPDPENQSRDLPLRDGGSYVATRYAPRMLTVLLIVKGDDYAERRANERRAAAVMSPSICSRAGEPGTLYLGRGDGVIRAIEAVYQGGLEYGPQGRMGPSARRVALSFFCPYVFFRDIDYTIQPIAVASGSVPKVNTAYAFTYEGTAPTYPIITLTGPATNPYLQHTGPDDVVRTVGLNYTLASSSAIEFDFNIKKKTIRLNPSTTNVELRGYVTTVVGVNTEFWELLPGANSILFKDQAGAPTMTAELKYYNRYEVL